jgi:hypothetical protein
MKFDLIMITVILALNIGVFLILAYNNKDK